MTLFMYGRFMLSKKIIVFILLCWSCFSFSSNSSFNHVNMYTSNYTSDVSIYSNGFMQAKLIIEYELNEGYLLQDIKLLRYEGDELSDFQVRSYENSYPHEIENSKNLKKTISKDFSSQFENFYLTTRKRGVTRICAQLNVINKLTNEKESYSTCNRSNNDNYITIHALEPKRYTINDFTILSEEIDWYDGVMEFKKYELIPKGWLLSQVISNGSSVEVFNSLQVASHKLSYFTQDIEVDSSLTLYRDINKNQKEMYIPAWALVPNKDVEKLSDKYKFQINTNNKINLIRSYGFKVNDRNGDYGILAKNPKYEQGIRNITFYDYYGNEGIIYVKRVDGIDKIHGGNLEDMDYAFY